MNYADLYDIVLIQTIPYKKLRSKFTLHSTNNIIMDTIEKQDCTIRFKQSLRYTWLILCILI